MSDIYEEVFKHVLNEVNTSAALFDGATHQFSGDFYAPGDNRVPSVLGMTSSKKKKKKKKKTKKKKSVKKEDVVELPLIRRPMDNVM